MKYVWFVRILVILVVKTSVIWPLQGEANFLYGGNYNFPLSKMSKVCTFLAETCGKCTELKACFWCSDSGVGEGSCYARNDLAAKQRCIGKVLSYWRKPCTEVTQNLYSSEDAERSVLIKLLLLLRKLRDSQKKEHRKTRNKNIFPKGNRKNALSAHMNLGDISNKDLPKQVSILLNKPINSSIQNIKQNVSTVIENNIRNSSIYIPNHRQHKNVSIYIPNHRQHKNVSMNSTNQENATMPLHKLKNVSADRHGDINASISCHMNSRTSCLRKHFCSWCDNNDTCCPASREKAMVVLPEEISNNGKIILFQFELAFNSLILDKSCFPLLLLLYYYLVLLLFMDIATINATTSTSIQCPHAYMHAHAPSQLLTWKYDVMYITLKTSR